MARLTGTAIVLSRSMRTLMKVESEGGTAMKMIDDLKEKLQNEWDYSFDTDEWDNITILIDRGERANGSNHETTEPIEED